MKCGPFFVRHDNIWQTLVSCFTRQVVFVKPWYLSGDWLWEGTFSSTTTSKSLSEVIMVDEEFVLLHQCLRYCYRNGENSDFISENWYIIQLTATIITTIRKMKHRNKSDSSPFLMRNYRSRWLQIVILQVCYHCPQYTKHCHIRRIPSC